MPYHKSTRYLHICIRCGQERFTTKRHNPSGFCAFCVHKEPRRETRVKDILHFSPGALYADETLQRFWSKVDKETACSCHPWEERCWLWTAQIHKKSGYGSISIREIKGKPYPELAHRFAYQAEYGALPEGAYVLHSPPCIVRHCVRHLYAGTAQQNTNDAKAMQRFPTGERHIAVHNNYASMPHGDAHWTHMTPERLKYGDAHWSHATPELVKRGEAHHNTTLTVTDVSAIRTDYASGMRICELVNKYTRSTTCIWSIVHRKTWRHIP